MSVKYCVDLKPADLYLHCLEIRKMFMVVLVLT